jgi:hypothetical protein
MTMDEHLAGPRILDLDVIDDVETHRLALEHRGSHLTSPVRD